MHPDVLAVWVLVRRRSVFVSKNISFNTYLINVIDNLFFKYRSECFCGNTEPTAKSKLADHDCSYKCSGDPNQFCGGYYTINVYETGLSSKF